MIGASFYALAAAAMFEAEVDRLREEVLCSRMKETLQPDEFNLWFSEFHADKEKRAKAKAKDATEERRHRDLCDAIRSVKLSIF